jgi:hypothetical protein
MIKRSRRVADAPVTFRVKLAAEEHLAEGKLLPEEERLNTEVSVIQQDKTL